MRALHKRRFIVQGVDAGSSDRLELWFVVSPFGVEMREYRRRRPLVLTLTLREAAGLLYKAAAKKHAEAAIKEPVRPLVTFRKGLES